MTSSIESEEDEEDEEEEETARVLLGNVYHVNEVHGEHLAASQEVVEPMSRNLRDQF